MHIGNLVRIHTSHGIFVGVVKSTNPIELDMAVSGINKEGCYVSNGSLTVHSLDYSCSVISDSVELITRSALDSYRGTVTKIDSTVVVY